MAARVLVVLLALLPIAGAADACKNGVGACEGNSGDDHLVMIQRSAKGMLNVSDSDDGSECDDDWTKIGVYNDDRRSKKDPYYQGYSWHTAVRVGSKGSCYNPQEIRNKGKPCGCEWLKINSNCDYAPTSRRRTYGGEAYDFCKTTCEVGACKKPCADDTEGLQAEQGGAWLMSQGGCNWLKKDGKCAVQWPPSNSPRRRHHVLAKKYCPKTCGTCDGVVNCNGYKYTPLPKELCPSKDYLKHAIKPGYFTFCKDMFGSPGAFPSSFPTGDKAKNSQLQPGNVCVATTFGDCELDRALGNCQTGHAMNHAGKYDNHGNIWKGNGDQSVYWRDAVVAWPDDEVKPPGPTTTTTTTVMCNGYTLRPLPRHLCPTTAWLKDQHGSNALQKEAAQKDFTRTNGNGGQYGAAVQEGLHDVITCTDAFGSPSTFPESFPTSDKFKNEELPRGSICFSHGAGDCGTDMYLNNCGNYMGYAGNRAPTGYGATYKNDYEYSVYWKDAEKAR